MKLLLSIISLLGIVYIMYSSIKHELLERTLIKNGEQVDAEIIGLQCNGRRDYIHLKVNGKLVSKRIYPDKNDCSDLSHLTTIKVATNGTHIVFAKKAYNDWFEAEMIAIVLLGLTAFAYVVWKRLIPALA